MILHFLLIDDKRFQARGLGGRLGNFLNGLNEPQIDI
jgi:hypothetical protein